MWQYQLPKNTSHPSQNQSQEQLGPLETDGSQPKQAKKAKHFSAASKQAAENVFKPYKLNHYPQRFEENRANLIHLLKESTLLELWPDLRDQASAGFQAKRGGDGVWEKLQKLCIIVPSLLAKTGNF